MISFNFKIVLHVLLESSVTPDFRRHLVLLESNPTGQIIRSLWSMLRNAEARTGHDFVLVPRPRIRLRNHVQFYLSFGKANYSILPVTDEQRAAKAKMASHIESVAP